ncbi:CPBP family intramembrane glutamic endopeptidase [Arthrobacter sp. Br18]|uniref:CPBP family intramembrane glutamic endopeptidase n=1 Tax=Arthrobacter sp. Br18 TaxID=1312954 RepID=UPI00047A2007|nr:CPBP family intramembrane glutamic endopeptidase [Arthrobacter sp. Br18]
MTDSIRRHPVAALLTWFFTVGQAIAFLPVVAGAGGTHLPPMPFIIASNMVGMLLPTLAITRLVEGDAGLKALWGRIIAFRCGAGWYAFALLVVPAAAGVLGLLLGGPPRDLSPGTLVAALVSGLLVQTVVGLAVSNLWEEAAWTGFVQARLQNRHGALKAALLTAPLFALQHVSLVAGNAAAVVILILVAVLAVPFRAATGWLYHRTGSIFLVGLFHAAGNAVAVGGGFGDGMLPLLYPGIDIGPMHLLASAAVGVVVLILTRGRLGVPRTSPPFHPGA